LVARGGAGWRARPIRSLVDRAIGLIALGDHNRGRACHWSYQLIADPNAARRCCSSISAALAGGLGFLVLGRLQWPWLKRWWATHHIQCLLGDRQPGIFSR